MSPTTFDCFFQTCPAPLPGVHYARPGSSVNPKLTKVACWAHGLVKKVSSSFCAEDHVQQDFGKCMPHCVSPPCGGSIRPLPPFPTGSRPWQGECRPLWGLSTDIPKYSDVPSESVADEPGWVPRVPVPGFSRHAPGSHRLQAVVLESRSLSSGAGFSRASRPEDSSENTSPCL